MTYQRLNQLLLAALLSFAPISPSAFAANYYVTETGSGAKNGADWNNAMALLPSDGTDPIAPWAQSTNLERSSTYYMAGGTYPHYAFDDVESGSSWIRILKATQANAGNVAGWAALSDTQRNGQTTFGYLYFRRDFYELDGQVRDEANWADSSKYGFRINISNPHWDLYAIDLNSYKYSPGADRIKFKYFDIGSPAGTTWSGDPQHSGAGSGFYLMPGSDTSPGHDDIYIGYSNIHNVLLLVKSSFTSNVIFEFNHCGPGFSKEGIAHQHGNGWIIRNNRFVDLNSHPNVEAGTSVIGVFGITPGTADSDNWEIYGNVFMETGTYPTTHCCGTILGGERDHYLTKTYQPVSNWKVYNNVFYNMHGSDVGISLHGLNNTAFNNLFYQANGSAGFSCGTDLCNSKKADCAPASYQPTCDFTWCVGGGCNGYPGTKFIGTEDPFISPLNYNFKLKPLFAGVSPIDKGKNLTTLSGFNTSDPAGTSRGQGAGWDIGAYEYTATPPGSAPVAPSGLNVSN